MKKFNVLAEVFDYPGKEFPQKAEAAFRYLSANFPEAAKEFEPFLLFARETNLEEQEEVFLRTFEVQGITTLDLCYILFGDDYKRGACLVNLNREHREVGNETRGELADHLPAVLRLIPKMKDQELAGQIVERIVLPALHGILVAFGPEKIALKNKVYKKHHTLIIETSAKFALVYRSAIQALVSVLLQDYSLAENKKPEKSEAFLKNINTELVNAQK